MNRIEPVIPLFGDVGTDECGTEDSEEQKGGDHGEQSPMGDHPISRGESVQSHVEQDDRHLDE